MASVELPAQQVLSELMARGVSDVVVAVVASPQSTVIGGATQTVRDLVAAWEQRDVMAREVAVDVASHSPQVDPILDELTDVLAELNPMTPEVPYYSATSFDPREQPVCDADYWVDNLRHTVRFAAAVQAALEDGYRVFAELAPHPLLTHAVEQTARRPRHAAGRPGRHAARAGAAARAARFPGRSAQRRRGSRLLRAVPGWAAGGRAAADLDAPSAVVDSRTVRIPGRRALAPFRCIRCWARMCGCTRSRSATSGRPRSAPRHSPGWATTRYTMWPRFLGRPTARWP